MDNITMDAQTPLPTPAPVSAASTQDQVRLTDVNVTDENSALNLLVSFINLAQKRGVYSIDESAKIWECIKFFITQPPAP